MRTIVRYPCFTVTEPMLEVLNLAGPVKLPIKLLVGPISGAPSWSVTPWVT
jgi:hypothetical protein